MASSNYTPSRIAKLYSVSKEPFFNEKDLDTAEKSGKIPQREVSSGKKKKSWSIEDLPQLGERMGFLKAPRSPIVATVFVTKGGVLKSSLSLNLARISALHGIKTCVVGLDMQADITSALGFDNGLDEAEDLSQALKSLDSVQGIPEAFFHQVPVQDLLQKTDLPSLQFIPETAELISVDQALLGRNRREHWLKMNVIEPLKEHYDFILLDCSPNWSQLITNALTACDALISPLECKINNFRNFKLFSTFVQEFKMDMGLDFQQIYVPTRFSPGRRLSTDILNWYHEQLPECTEAYIRESTVGEEAMAMNLSLPEYSPGHSTAIEMNRLVHEIWQVFQLKSEDKYDVTRISPPADSNPEDLVWP